MITTKRDARSRGIATVDQPARLYVAPINATLVISWADSRGPVKCANTELGEAVDRGAVTGDAAGGGADVDDIGDGARRVLGGLQEVRERRASSGDQRLQR